jgi:ABC-2 type transport system permease protein
VTARASLGGRAQASGELRRAGGETLEQVSLVARRSVRRTLRQPALIVPTIVFPLLLLAINASGLDVTKNIPNFPADSYLDFALVVTFMQGGLFAATTAGTELATDIETGFLNRLQLTPLRAPAILVGQLAGAMCVAFLSSLIYLGVGLLAGAHVAAGVGGAVLLVVLAMLVALAFGGLGSIIGARTGSAEAVQGMFPLLFVFFFLSSMNLPRNLIEVDWFRDLATLNPVSYMIEAIRSLVIEGWDAEALALGFACAGGIAAIAVAAAGSALRTRMVRT